jgi:cell division septation protein DedD
MSTHDDGHGRKAGPNLGSQFDFTNKPSVGHAPGVQTWGNNALKAQQSGVTLMAHGAGRPGQPAGGHRPIFGGGSPVFAQMPTYTPVTRGPDSRPPTPQPQQQAYTSYDPSQAASTQQSQQAASGLSYPSPPSPAPLNYPSSHPAAAPSYQSPQPGTAPSYQGSYQPQAPSPAQAASYQAIEFAPQGYQATNQPARAPSYSGAEQAPYPASTYNGAQGLPDQAYQDQSSGDASFPEPSTGDASFPEASFDQNFGDANFANQNYAKQSFGDASFPEQQSFDASFPEPSFSGAHDFGQQDQLGPDHYAQPEGQSPGFDSFTEEPTHGYGGQVLPSDPRRQLQAFDAIYDQPPQISLGSNDRAQRAAQDFYEGERIDADFLDEGQAMPPPGARAKNGMTIRGRSAFMVGSALLGAIALGGALAFAYKQSGGGLGTEQPPLVTADSRPVKELPDQPGGREFPHKNKLIYDRLQNGDEPETERLVPRQENVAVPALPPSADGGPAPVATTDLATPATQAVGTPEPVAVASVEDGSMPDGGPRKVKTMVVRPDGSVMAPPAVEAPAAVPTAEAAPQQEVASLQASPPPPEAKPKPAPKPAQTVAAAPQAAAAPTKYVVQVASKKNQTEALASFADMQQKYPALLANYRPMVQKADLGAKGTWYRLRIGPIGDKTAATKLCSQLKSQGLPGCLVMAQ